MAKNSTKVNQTTTKAVLTGFSQKAVAGLLKLLNTVEIQDKIDFTTMRLDRADEIHCPLTVAILGRNDNLHNYLESLAYLKLINKIDTVVALVDNHRKNEIENEKLSCAADNILFFPMKASQLAQMVTRKQIPEKSKNISSTTTKDAEFLKKMLEEKILTPMQMQRAINYARENSLPSLEESVSRLELNIPKANTLAAPNQADNSSVRNKQIAGADLKMVALIPENIARQHNCIATEKIGNTLSVAMSDPHNLQLMDLLRDQTNFAIKPIQAKTKEIQQAINKHYTSLELHKGASELINDISEKILTSGISGQQDDPSSDNITSGIVKLLNLIVGNAVKDKATDIHIEPMENETIIRYRINGEMRQILNPPKAAHNAIINRIKILANLDLEQRNLPQDGGFAIKFQNLDINLRTSLLPSIFGEKAVISILDKETFDNSITNIGFSESDLTLLLKYLAVPYGMVMISGPAGSGKTTTLYAALQEIIEESKNIVTVEDPVETQIEGITQVQVNHNVGLTMAEALKSVQRQDADTILISELKDKESAETAVKMSLTGHLVLSSILSDNAPGVIHQLLDIGISPLLLGSALNLIIFQRIVKKICPKCRTPHKLPREIVTSMNLSDQENTTFYIGNGCVSCNGTGFHGQTGIFELLPVTKDIRKLIYKNVTIEELNKGAQGAGFQSLMQKAVNLAVKGIITANQALTMDSDT